MKLFEYKRERLHGLDHLRAIAIFLVMVFHFGKDVPAWLMPIQRFGWTGVDLFFVLSGFLIGSQLLKEQRATHDISLKQFYLKRFFRIVPVYLAVILLYYFLGDLREGKGLPSIWRFLTFTQNFGLDVQNHNSFSHAWSLCIEEQFYLSLPLAIILTFSVRLQKWTPIFILILFGLGLVFRLYNWYEHVQVFIDEGNRRQMAYGFIGKVYYPSYNRMDGLLMGVAIAAIFEFKPKISGYLIKHGNVVLAIGVFLCCSAYILFNNFISFRTAIFGFPVISLAYGTLVIAAICPGSLLYKFQWKASLILATLSYSIYLTHKQLYHLAKIAMEKLELNISSSGIFWICIGMAIIGGFLLHVIVEKPFLRLRKIILTKNPSPK